MSLAPFFFLLLCLRSSEICQLHRLDYHHLEFDGHFCMLSKVFPCFDIECFVLQFRCFETDSDALGLHTMCNSEFVQLILTFYFFWVASAVMALIQDAPPGWLLISCINWFGLGVDTIICNPHKHIWKLVLDTNWYSSVAHTYVLLVQVIRLWLLSGIILVTLLCVLPLCAQLVLFYGPDQVHCTYAIGFVLFGF